MGLLSWLTGKSPKQEESSPLLNDHVIVGKIASLIDFQLNQETEGLGELLKPTCMAVLRKDGSVSLRWPSRPEFEHDVVSFALINRLPAFNGFVQTIVELSKLENREEHIKNWLQLMGTRTVDTIAAEALCEMKSNAEQHQAIAGKRLTSGILAVMLTLLIVVSSGCFMANPYYKVSKSGASKQQISQDNFECQRLSQGYSVTGIASGGQGIVTGGADVNRTLWWQCLQGRGYSVSSRSWSDHVDEGDRLKAEHTWLSEHWEPRRGVNTEFDLRLAKYNAEVTDFDTWLP